ncbi:Gfo/Idh/MocA family oxidoreductase [Pseudokineococcus basanitobsidens]|uniref:Gfo/Idh/MocA family oxidoreductase n=1 Tax=Pseudokineococcus basanitobsidens TaxID=1926649 RepID=A0ABU8RG25_9ACTN
MSGAGLVVAVAGLGFGAEFVPIYRRHPEVADVVLVEPDAARRAAAAERFGLGPGCADVADVLADPRVDAVHLLAPVPLHADLAVAVLEAGKHCASAVPAATSLEDLDRLVAAERASGRSYMMMETTVYARELLAVREMHERGELGEPTLYRGCHLQQLDGFPVYWQGFPPMHYATHALAPVLSLLGTTVERVSARGAGRLTPERRTGGFDNPFPAEAGLFALRGSDVLADVTVSFFQTARSYVEGFCLYGDRRGVEWPEDNEGDLTVHDMSGPAPGSRGNRVVTRRLAPRDRPELLPEPLRPFVRPTEVHLPGAPAPTRVGADHGGSHPFLVDEFVRSAVEGRPAAVDARTAAAWTAPGVCAHTSALEGGRWVEVPDYRSS